MTISDAQMDALMERHIDEESALFDMMIEALQQFHRSGRFADVAPIQQAAHDAVKRWHDAGKIGFYSYKGEDTVERTFEDAVNHIYTVFMHST